MWFNTIYDLRLFLIICDIRLCPFENFWSNIIYDPILFLIIYDPILFLIIYDIRFHPSQREGQSLREFMIQYNLWFKIPLHDLWSNVICDLTQFVIQDFSHRIYGSILFVVQYYLWLKILLRGLWFNIICDPVLFMVRYYFVIVHDIILFIIQYQLWFKISPTGFMVQYYLWSNIICDSMLFCDPISFRDYLWHQIINNMTS